jgi:type II secretory pathway component PulF
MSDIFTLTTDEPEVDTTTAESAASPVAAWNPGAAGGFTAPGAEAPPKRGKGRGKSTAAELPYKPLPEPKVKKALTAKEQAKADKDQLIKERESDAAAMRINGVDGDVEIPKKPWLTFFSGKRAKSDEISETLTDLASMLENGDSERKSVDELAKQYADYDIGQAYERVVMLLDRGVTLSNAMADQEDNFPPVVRELIAAAKLSKDLHRNLRQAALIIKEAGDIKAKVRGVLFKPGFMCFFLLAFTFAAIQWLLPMTASMFTGIGAKAPTTTVIIMGIGAWLKWVILAVIALAFIASVVWKLFLKSNERMAIAMDTFALKAPLVGDISRMSAGARFCDVLAACLGVGMSELESLETAGRACGNKALAAWVSEHSQRQRYGVVNFSDVSKTELLPWNFRNRLEVMTSLTKRIEILQELALTFHQKSQERLNRFAERIGPITETVVVAVIVVVVLLVVSPVLAFIPTLIQTIGQ